jgi:hypothetical protein
MIRENDGWENWNMIKICDYPCENRREAEQEEDKYMTELKASMNMIRASRTKQQYYEDNREKIQEKKKEYNEKNKETIQEKKKEYNKEYRDNNKERIQQYRDNNKEKINQENKEYYEKNKTTILKNMKEIVKCECGCEVTKSNLKRHTSNKKHIDLMKCI